MIAERECLPVTSPMTMQGRRNKSKAACLHRSWCILHMWPQYAHLQVLPIILSLLSARFNSLTMYENRDFDNPFRPHSSCKGRTLHQTLWKLHGFPKLCKSWGHDHTLCNWQFVVAVRASYAMTATCCSCFHPKPWALL